MNSNAPNLFHYTTKELAQDAALAYILASARPAYRESHPRLHELGTDMLHALLATKIDETAFRLSPLSTSKHSLSTLTCWH